MERSPRKPGRSDPDAQSGLTDSPRLASHTSLDGLDLRAMFAVLAHGWKIITATVLVVSCLCAAYLATTRPVYEAHSLIMIEPEQTSVASGLGSGVEESLGLRRTRLDNEVWFINNSLGLAEQVAGNLLAQRTTVPDENSSASPDSSFLDSLPLTVIYDETGVLLSNRQVALALLSRIDVEPDGEAAGWQPVDGLRIVARSSESGEAALIANAFADAYVARSQESSRASIVGSKGFLEAQEQKLRTNLESLEQDLEQYLSEEGAVALDEEASQTVAQIAEIEAQRDEARIELEMHQATLISLRSELAQIEPRLVQRLASGVDRELELTQEQLVDLELRMEQIFLQNPGIRDDFGENAELVDLDRRARELKTRAARLSEQYVEEVLASGGIDPSSNRAGATENSGLVYVSELRRRIAEEQITLSGLQAKQSVLSQRLRQMEEKLVLIPRQSLKIAGMRRAQEATERLYIFIVEKLQEARILEESELGYAEVVMPAFDPISPVHPRASRTMALALLFGLTLGSGFVFLRRRLDLRIRDPQALRERGYALIGIVPVAEESADSASPEKFDHSEAGRPNIAMVANPLSPVSEAYRKIRTNIQFARPDHPIKSIVITSPGPGEGKSTTAANLAVSMAGSGRKTVLVDGDMRRPVLHRIFGTVSKPGLSDLISGNITLAEADFSTPLDDFYLIPAGSQTFNTAELLSSERAERLWLSLASDFDMVVIDTPPVDGFSDALLIGNRADGTIVVASASETEWRSLEEAVSAISGVASLLGCVLNRFDPRESARYGYQTYGSYGYNYSSYYRRPESQLGSPVESHTAAGKLGGSSRSRLDSRLDA